MTDRTSYFARRGTMVGTVVSAKMEKTAVVAVEKWRRHPLYGKAVRRTRKYYAHNEGNVAREGDLVRIVESRPLSRLKRWVIAEVIRRAGAEHRETEAEGLLPG
jgi:small subunit ribosomal protein S17